MANNSVLNNINVLEIANENGMYCGKLLSEMGAEVIKIEKTGGDDTRNYSPFHKDDPHMEKSLFFNYFNTGKKSITLNLESDKGREIFKQLARNTDIIIETLPQGYMGSLGLDYTSIKKTNPKLVMLSITPFGQTGQYKNYSASSEIVPLAMGGLLYLNGETFMPPIQLGHFLAGHVSGIYGVLGILSSIYKRLFTGQGDCIDLSIQECVASWLEASYVRYQYDGAITMRNGTEHPFVTPGKNYPCKDGYCNIGAVRWDLMLNWLLEEEIDVGELVDIKYVDADSARYLFEARPLVNKVMSELTSRYTRKEVMHEGQKRGIPIGALEDAKSIYQDEHLKARDYFIEIDHPVIGKLMHPGVPFRMSESPLQVNSPAPLVGQHNEEVYQNLGISKEQLSELKNENVV